VNAVELRQLNSFVAIAEEQSFTRAAERLWVAQPGLSTQIRRLESELGVRLFERRPSGVDLTDAGELFLERARKAVAAAELARSTGDDRRAGLVATIRLGIVTGAGWPFVGTLLARFGRDHPDVELTVVESYAGTLLRDLHDGRLDAVLVPSTFASSAFLRVSVGEAPWLVLAGPQHRLAGSAGPVGADELDGEPVVVTGHRDGAAYDRAVAETLAELGLTPELRPGGSGPALFGGVARGDAIALTTTPAAVGGMVVRPLDTRRAVKFALLSLDRTPAPALEAFIGAAEAVEAPARPVLRAVA
jgi:DNA-binding transcriptional LysR family regulator